MSNNKDLATTLNNGFSWDNKTALAEVKKAFAPDLNETEFAMFIGLGKSLELNPYAKEIYAVKFGNKVSLIIGRDGYRRNAQKSPDYDYHYSEAIYSNDHYEVVDGLVNHKRKVIDRGALLGAYCVVKRKGSSRYMYSEVLLSEYDKKSNNWNTMKETMIKKVAESQALRMAFQELFTGTSDESELDTIKANQALANSHTEKLKEKINAKSGEIIDVTPDNVEAQEPATIDQLTAIRDLMEERGFDEKRKKKMMDYYHVDNFARLTQTDADNCIEQLCKIAPVIKDDINQ